MERLSNIFLCKPNKWGWNWWSQHFFLPNIISTTFCVTSTSYILSPKMGNVQQRPPALVGCDPSELRSHLRHDYLLVPLQHYRRCGWRSQRPAFFGRGRGNSWLRTWRAFSTCLKSSQIGWKGDTPYIETFFSGRVLISAIHLRHVIYTLIMIMEAFLWQMTQHPESQPLPDQVEPKESSCIVPGFLLALIQWPVTEIYSHIDLGRARSLQFRYLKYLLIDT